MAGNENKVLMCLSGNQFTLEYSKSAMIGQIFRNSQQFY